MACCSRRVGKDVAPGDAARAAQAVPGMRSASKCSPRSGIDLHHLIASAEMSHDFPVIDIAAVR